MCREIMESEFILKNRVKELRARLNLNQAEVAEASGVTRQTILAIEKGRLTPSVAVALRLARVLREPVDYVFYLERVSETDRAVAREQVVAQKPDTTGMPAATVAITPTETRTESPPVTDSIVPVDVSSPEQHTAPQPDIPLTPWPPQESQATLPGPQPEPPEMSPVPPVAEMPDKTEVPPTVTEEPGAIFDFV